MRQRQEEESLMVDDRPKGFFCCCLFDFFRPDKKARNRREVRTKKIAKSNEVEVEKQQQTTVVQSLIVDFPSLITQFVDIQQEYKSHVGELCEDKVIIGVVGDNAIQLEDSVQIVRIGKQQEINCLSTLRSSCLSHIFITNGFQEYASLFLFQQRQTFSVKLHTMKEVQCAIKDWEEFLKAQCSQKVLRNVLEKLILKVTSIDNCFWITFNQRQSDAFSFEGFYWPNIGLEAEEDAHLIDTLYDLLTLKELIQLIQIKRQKPEQYNKNIVKELLSRKMPEELYFSKILSSSSDHSFKYSSDSLKYFPMEEGLSQQLSEEGQEESLEIRMSLISDSVSSDEEVPREILLPLNRRFKSMSDGSRRRIEEEID